MSTISTIDKDDNSSNINNDKEVENTQDSCKLFRLSRP